LPAAVKTGVVVRLDGVGRRPDDDERHVGDLVDDVAADVGDLFLATCELPHAFPQALDLALVPLARRVALLGEIVVAEEPRGLEAKHIGHLVGVGIEQFLVGDPGRSCDGVVGWW
jgi:hypothetical protein